MNLNALNLLNTQLEPIIRDVNRTMDMVAARHDISPVAPPDLREEAPLFNYTPDGAPVSSLLLPTDFTRGLDQPAGMLLVIVLAIAILAGAGVVTGITGLTVGCADLLGKFGIPALASAPIMMFIVSALGITAVLSAFFGKTGLLAGLWAVLLSPPFALIGAVVAFFLPSTARGGNEALSVGRDEALYRQTIDDMSSSMYLKDWRNTVRIKHKQAETAARDKTRFIALGRATGYFKDHGDPYAPESGTVFGYAVDDMSMHTAIMGMTGTGKTVLINRIAKQIFQATDSGALGLCGKGTGARELVGLDENYVLLNPETSKLALFAGMGAMDVVDALAVVDAKSDPFFTDLTRTLLKAATVLLKALADAKVEGFKFTPSHLYRLLESNGTIGGGKDRVKHGQYRQDAINAAFDMHQRMDRKSSMLLNAIDFFENAWQATQGAEKTFAAVQGTYKNWLEPLFSHESIIQWAECDEGVDVTECLQGKRIGIDVPGIVYGFPAAAIITNLVRQRVYTALKRRGNGWRNVAGQKPVLLLIDEMHLVWQAESGTGMDDNSMVSIARSLGGIFLVGTQSVNSLRARFGEDKTREALGNFRNFGCYEADMETTDYVSGRIGAINRPIDTIYDVDDEVAGINVTAALSREYMTPHNFGGRTGSDAASFAKRLIKNTPLRFAVGAQSDTAIDDVHAAKIQTLGNRALATHAVATADELNIMLSERFACVFVAQRAGCKRRDVIIVDPNDDIEEMAA